MNMINNFELNVKRIKYSAPYGKALNGEKDVATVAAKLIGDKAQEHFIVFAINTKNEIVGYWTAAIGSIDSCSVDMRSVFRMALVVGAVGIVVAHCHPSGYLVPSGQDIEVTKRIRHAAQVLDLILVDHVIVSGLKHYSMRQDKPEVFK